MIQKDYDFISKIPADITHTSFLANKEISKKLIELEDVYKKIDCNFGRLFELSFS